jgi:hypothetical protein
LTATGYDGKGYDKYGECYLAVGTDSSHGAGCACLQQLQRLVPARPSLTLTPPAPAHVSAINTTGYSKEGYDRYGYDYKGYNKGGLYKFAGATSK